MKWTRHITVLMAVLLTVLSTASCSSNMDENSGAELTVSLYIPSTVMTKAETGLVNPTAEETRITTLQIWAFLSEDGSPVSYHLFDNNQLEDKLNMSGLPYATITRFGMPLDDEMFTLLTTGIGDPAQRPKVDVYAVANAASALNTLPDENTSRDVLDQIILTKFGGSTADLVKTVPTAGLPMSGVLKNADVTGGYPVLNISTLRLTKAVSKIRFVFSQQENPANGDIPAAPVNSQCKIISISFDGTSGGKDCQIAASEKLFTNKATTSENLFDIGTPPSYVPLNATLSGESGAPLISNDQLTCLEDPESLFFHSAGHEVETAEQYETRLNNAIAASSQVGPIYLRETDKVISGTITYRISADGPDQTAEFSMEAGDVFSRNHSWIVYACFSEETMSLSLKVVVLPWEWARYPIDFTSSSVNVIRRFSVTETNPATFSKVQTDDGYFDVTFWDSVKKDDAWISNVLNGDIIIATPVGAHLRAIPVFGALAGHSVATGAIEVIFPEGDLIYPNYPDGRIEHCRIPIQIKCNREKKAPGTGSYTDTELEGNYMDLHFCVEIGDEVRFIDLGSESIDLYRFILSQNWEQIPSSNND